MKLFKASATHSGSNCIANTAISFAFIAIRVASIFFCKFMTSRAMRFSAIICGSTKTTKNIFRFFNHFKVIWVYTKPISAKMINFKTIFNLVLHKFIGNSMCPFHGPSVFGFNTKFSIAKGVWSMPKPASFCFSNFTPKSLFHCQSHVSHRVLVIYQGGT